jgi:hypothetical protein
LVLKPLKGDELPIDEPKGVELKAGLGPEKAALGTGEAGPLRAVPNAEMPDWMLELGGGDDAPKAGAPDGVESPPVNMDGMLYRLYSTR